MRRTFLSLFSLTAFLGATPIAAQSELRSNGDDTTAIAQFDQFLSDYRDKHRMPSLSAVILKEGKLYWEKAYGWSDDEAETPATTQTTYSIASVTKPIVATALLAEADKGNLNLNLSMRSDPGWAGMCAWLSTSGILFGRGGVEEDGTKIPAMDCKRDLSLGDMLNMRANGDGSRFVYNPISFARIDRAISGSGGRALRDIVRQRVMDRAGIRDIALGWRDPKGGSALRLLALPFDVKNGKRTRSSISDDDFRASAGIKASVRHVAQFDQALEKGQLLSSNWYRRIFEDPIVDENGDYRWGWFVQNWQGHQLAWHSGWDPGRYSALYLKIPEKNLTLILLANTEALWWGNSLARAEIETSPIAAKFLSEFVK
ncbi:MAG: serine hydrolase domain-containing protein [Parasphingorhabdus sp.]|uniref:serine hydrolase domain-containing protein n=1 Tax=Parasphingorhabdus sp. TaxID=2709688 RepID=UPI00329727D1